MKRPRRLGRRGALVTASLSVLVAGRDARRMADVLVLLARAGELDAKLVRVLRYRRLVDSGG